MTPVLICGLLLLLGIAFIFLEIFIPSAGLLSFLAVAAIASSIVYAFIAGGVVLGTIFLALTVLLVPIVVAFAVRWYPETPLGRKILYQPAKEEEVLPDSEEYRRRRELKGKLGVAKSPLLPSGAVRIDGRTYDAVSQGGVVDQGDPVVVVRVEGTHIVVRKSEGSQLPVRAETVDDVLAQPIESLGLDPFDPN